MKVNGAAMSDRIAANPEILAEAAVFALAPKVGRVKAQVIVKEALAKGAPLASVMEDGVAPDPNDVIAPSKALRDSIFAVRKTSVS